jgi:hypothetical protein
MASGKIVKIKGRLIKIRNYYEQLSGQFPEKYCKLPSFGLEVFKIEDLGAAEGVTHMAISVSWNRRSEDRMLTHYFNVQDRQQFVDADNLLESSRKAHAKSLLFNYDDLACFSPKWKYKIPEYNAMLRPWLKGKSL